MTPNDKPEWLLRLQFEVSQHYAQRGIDNTPEEWMDLLDFIDAFIQTLYTRRDINVRSEVTTDLMTEDGETRLLIKRNGKPLQVYYMQPSNEPQCPTNVTTPAFTRC